MRRGVIYCRISDDRAGKGLGVARQETECREWCAANGVEVVDVLTDNDKSAYTRKRRPNYELLCAGIASREWDTVVAWNPDRLHRHPAELEHFIDLIEQAKVKVHTIGAGHWDLGTAGGRLAARQMGSYARYESDVKSDRSLSKHRQLAEAGSAAGGGSRPYGYLQDRVTIDPVEAEHIRQAARDILDGVTLRSVVRSLTTRGVPTVTGKPWTTTALRRMLTAPRSAGYREHGGKLHEGTWEPLLDELTWRRLKALLLDPARRVNGAPRTYLLTGGIARCGLCDHPLVARPRSDKRRSYVCASGPGFHGCGKIRILADAFEADVVERVAHRLERSVLPDVDDDIVTAALDRTDALRARAADLAVTWVRDGLSKDQFQAANAALQSDLAVAEAEAARVAGPPLMVPAEGFAVAPMERQRAILKSLGVAVVVSSGVRGLNRYDRDRVAVV